MSAVFIYEKHMLKQDLINSSSRHCEEQCDEAISSYGFLFTGLFSGVRNDGYSIFLPNYTAHPII
jgi:hypothetical protein